MGGCHQVKITTHRALLDYALRSRTRANSEMEESGDVNGRPPPAIPGVVGMTRHRITLDLANDHVRAKIIGLCEAAIGDDTVHEAKRDAIAHTLRQIRAAEQEEADVR